MLKASLHLLPGHTLCSVQANEDHNLKAFPQPLKSSCLFLHDWFQRCPNYSCHVYATLRKNLQKANLDPQNTRDIVFAAVLRLTPFSMEFPGTDFSSGRLVSSTDPGCGSASCWQTSVLKAIIYSNNFLVLLLCMLDHSEHWRNNNIG